MRRTKEGAAHTRSTIQKAALALFSAQGVAGTTLTEVAKKAGVTRGAIYWHFANKEALLRSLKDDAVVLYEQMGLAGGREEEPDPLGKLREMLCAVLTDAAENTTTRQVFQLWLDRGRLGNQDRKENAREENLRRCEAVRQTESILQNAVRQGQLPHNFDVQLGALTVFTFIDGALIGTLLAPDSCSSELKTRLLRMTDAVLYMLRSGNPHLVVEGELVA